MPQRLSQTQGMRRLALTALAVFDLLAVIGATVLAIILRFDYLRVEYLTMHLPSAPFVLATYFGAFYLFRLYRYRWPYAGVEVFWSVFLANVLAAVLSAIWQYHIDGERMPRSIIIIVCVLSTALIGGQRVVLRALLRHLRRVRAEKPALRWREEPKRTVILGAGPGSIELLAALENEHTGRHEIIGILDQDERYHGTYMHGIKILGSWERLYDLVQRHEVDEVIIAMHSATTEQMREYMLACCRHKVAVRLAPVAAEWLTNPAASRRQLRAETVHVEDLLHRPSMQIPLHTIGASLTGKRVLVTGAGGSIGAELCRQILSANPAALILLGHGENSIHEIMLELQQRHPGSAATLTPVICDIRDAEHVDYVLAQFRPQILLHAAAHKHVPLMEQNICEAVMNNVGGTRNVLRAASRHAVERLVMISTDKAVNPSSVMGATKFLCEELVRAEAERSGVCCLIVRFGNVLGSRGSVLPHFQQQMLRGGPVTVTHPEMRRYFMTIPEAVSLVLCAGLTGQSGQLFVLDMGDPVRILRLAEDLIRLSGLTPYRDIPIEFCGLRPGEKLSEELLSEREARESAAHEHLMVVNRPQYIDRAVLDSTIECLLRAAALREDRTVLHELLRIIPTFRAEAERAETLPVPSA